MQDLTFLPIIQREIKKTNENIYKNNKNYMQRYNQSFKIVLGNEWVYK